MAGLASAVRFLHLAASILAFGVFAFLCLIAYPAARRAGLAARTRLAHFQQNQWRIFAFSLAAIFATGLLGFVLQAAIMAGRPAMQALQADILIAALSTQYGQVWLLRQGCLILLAGLFLRLVRQPRPRLALHYVCFALAGILLALMAGASHAAAGEGATLIFQLVADALHLLAAGVWLGALIPLALLFSWCRRGDVAWAGTVAQDATRRFSWLGIGAVTTLLITGAANAWNLVGGIAPLVGTAYGRLLLLKLGLLLFMLAFAAMNLLYLKPRLLAISPHRRRYEFRDILAGLRRNTLAEAGLGLALLLMVAMLGITAPARHVQPEWPFSFRLNWEVNKNIPAKRFSILLGAGLAVAALAPFGYAIARRYRRRWALSLGLISLGGGAALALPALSLDAYPTTYRRPAVPYQAISVTSGLNWYRQGCITCHGVAGFGDGPMAATLNAKPADLTAKHTGDHTAGDLFWWLSQGVKDKPMPGFKQILSEEARWDLINFLRTLSAAEQARPMAPLVEPAWLVAPDFVYRTLSGENKSLKDHRGQKVVLLVLATLPQSRPRLQQLDRLYARLADAGVEVLAVPGDARAFRKIGPRLASLSIVMDGSEEIFTTYSLFRRSLSETGMRPDPPVPAHMEFLVDRQGYIRARWIPAESTGWSNTDLLLQEVAQLNQEKLSAPAPDDHVH